MCGTCPSGYYGVGCTQICAGGAATPCSGHGKCSGGESGDGTCACVLGYAGAPCDILCPDGAGNLCSGHGVCDKVSGTCKCEQYYGDIACGTRCEGAGTAELCSSNGYCNDGSTGTGRCVCSLGFTGAACNVTCLDGRSRARCMERAWRTGAASAIPTPTGAILRDGCATAASPGGTRQTARSSARSGTGCSAEGGGPVTTR